MDIKKEESHPIRAAKLTGPPPISGLPAQLNLESLEALEAALIEVLFASFLSRAITQTFSQNRDFFEPTSLSSVVYRESH